MYSIDLKNVYETDGEDVNLVPPPRQVTGNLHMEVSASGASS